MRNGDPNRFARLRQKREMAGIIHKQFRLLEKDIPEATELLTKLLNDANKAFEVTSKQVDEERLGRGETFRGPGRPRKSGGVKGHEQIDNVSNSESPEPS